MVGAKLVIVLRTVGALKAASASHEPPADYRFNSAPRPGRGVSVAPTYRRTGLRECSLQWRTTRVVAKNRELLWQYDYA